MIVLELLYLVTLWSVTGSTPLIIISIDGMKHSFLSRENTPFLYCISRRGVYSTNVHPAFPSKTFPNHQTISTGVHPEVHGIINNYMVRYNPNGTVNRTFLKDNLKPFWWNSNPKIIPIYTANELSSNTRKSGSVYWPGSSVAYNGHKISFFYKEYDKNVGTSARLQSGAKLVLSDQYNLVMIYLDELDRAVHKFGYNNSFVREVLKSIDENLKEFYKNVSTCPEGVDLIIVGDHGFRELDQNKIIKPETLIPGLSRKIVYDGAVVGLYPENYFTSEDPDKESKLLVDELNKIANKRYVAYKKEDTPPKYHFSKHENIPPVTMIMRDGYYLMNKDKNRSADHGWFAYDDCHMRTVFIGYGPSFKRRRHIKKLDLTDIYKIACNILRIQPACHHSNGTVNLCQILRDY
ncbi:Bis(5'-adenosyl)-triphosphatase ENPP4 [Thelohanellus kitauei]|uniref:Bis(5'-adenosyl)-triphosphatase ENPP4 n=1 Tax=Thelohanellus kitauei TaxID=669202 RepID=A0A0C2MDQ8_THEKT|nr:Bis(5'-adenosyl)-triphosphatase ENPP4 [Thelohanellus kitauei]